MRTLVARPHTTPDQHVRALEFDLARLRRYADQLADALDNVLDVTPNLADTHTGLWSYSHDALARYRFNATPTRSPR